jgi:hypothetical protein
METVSTQASTNTQLKVGLVRNIRNMPEKLRRRPRRGRLLMRAIPKILETAKKETSDVEYGQRE